MDSSDQILEQRLSEYRDHVLRLYGYLIELLQSTRFEEKSLIINDSSIIPSKIVSQYGQLAYHILIVAFYQQMFQGILQGIFNTAEDIFQSIQSDIENCTLSQV